MCWILLGALIFACIMAIIMPPLPPEFEKCSQCRKSNGFRVGYSDALKVPVPPPPANIHSDAKREKPTGPPNRAIDDFL